MAYTLFPIESEEQAVVALLKEKCKAKPLPTTPAAEQIPDWLLQAQRAVDPYFIPAARYDEATPPKPLSQMMPARLERCLDKIAGGRFLRERKKPA